MTERDTIPRLYSVINKPLQLINEDLRRQFNTQEFLHQVLGSNLKKK